MTISASELPYIKTWRLRKSLTSLRKALAYNDTQNGRGLSRLMDEPLRSDIAKVEGELKRRKTLNPKKTGDDQ